MDEAGLLMGKLQRGGNADTNFQNLPFRDLAKLFHFLLQTGLVQMLHDQIKASVLFPQGIDPNDIGVGEGGSDFNLFQELLGKGGIVTEVSL